MLPQSAASFAAEHWETRNLLVRAVEARRAFFGGCLDCEALGVLLEQREAGAGCLTLQKSLPVIALLT